MQNVNIARGIVRAKDQKRTSLTILCFFINAGTAVIKIMPQVTLTIGITFIITSYRSGKPCNASEARSVPTIKGIATDNSKIEVKVEYSKRLIILFFYLNG